MTGWPVELPAVDDQSPPQVVGNDLLVVASQFAQTDGDSSIPRPGAWWLTSVAADGTLRTGARYEAPDVWPFRTARIAPDGAAYLMAMRGDFGAETTEIVAIDVDGVRAGWPQTVDGILSYPTIGPQGRVYVTRIVGSVYAPTQSQTLVFERDGRPVRDRLGAPAGGGGERQLRARDLAHRSDGRTGRLDVHHRRRGRVTRWSTGSTRPATRS